MPELACALTPVLLALPQPPVSGGRYAVYCAL